VHEAAMKIIQRVSNRIPKNWQPKTVEGSLTMHNSFEDINMTQGEWMILTRTRYMLEELEEILKQKGLYFENRFKKSYERDVQEAAIQWEHLRKGQLLHYKQIEKISKYMGPAHWDKQKIKGMTKESFYGIDTLIKDYGLNVKEEWYNSFDDCPIDRKEYIRAMRRNGESLNKDPRIQLSTIHSVKGGERQNVVLLSDLSHNTNKSYEKNPDDENRLFYVGATRTKENLHIVQPKDEYKSYPLEDL
jgi:superfamily I DNA/RNA helicase